ncbi:hypothetical protein PR202_ga25647 [Eleusine coracana subsp. coracana]|uniref:Uncharacterized protein n=1 Tax=Eleusine coracana subsp. coracana TaxID=191504 RepID=A0AAV5DBJ4_ELECO|nr:hypothetical protein PR202_ga25647 [Eleusine coracana subsp. coracana]
MAIPPPRNAGGGGGRKPRVPPLPPPRTLLTALVAAVALAVLCLLSSSSPAASLSGYRRSVAGTADKFLYWGDRVDCPGKHCDSCAGLGHQESSLRCALEEALFLGRIFVLPSRMCLSSVHNTKGTLQRNATSNKDHISRTIHVILDNSKTWHDIVSRSRTLQEGGVVHVQGITRAELKANPLYSTALIINRTASPLAWFAECKDRKNRSSVMLSYTFLPSMPSKKLRDAANQVLFCPFCMCNLIYFRNGQVVYCTDINYMAMLIDIACYFSWHQSRYKLAYSSNFSSILKPIIENNYQLFMVERLIMQGAKTFVKTMREFDSDLTLCDDPKKNTKVWKKPVYTEDR